MSKKLIRLITLALAIAMVAGLAVGCGEGGNKPGGAGGDAAAITGMQADVNPEDYRGVTVKYASWKDPANNADGIAIKRFTEKTGINVEWVQVPQSTYVSSISTLIASKNAPDVFFENGDFPGSLTVMQPLDAAKLDLTSPYWNQAVVKASTLDGHAYLVDAVSNIWTEVDICIYNNNIFDNEGIKTPAEYYEEGDWTFENFRKTCLELKNAGYLGCATLGETILGAAGASVFTYEDNKMKLTVDDHFMKVMTYASQMRVDGLLKNDRGVFDEGKTGMAFTNCYGLKKKGYFNKINPSYVSATYLPTWEKGGTQYTTGIYRGWGLVDGAKNPVAAGIFLCSYLDATLYDLEEVFLNDDVANFFYQITGEYPEDMIYYHGPDMIKTTGMGEHYHNAFQYYTPNNVKTFIDGCKNTMNLMVEKANEVIDNERALIKKGEEDGTYQKLSGN